MISDKCDVEDKANDIGDVTHEHAMNKVAKLTRS